MIVFLVRYLVSYVVSFLFFFFQAEDGIRDAQESRGLGDVYKRQVWIGPSGSRAYGGAAEIAAVADEIGMAPGTDLGDCLLYTSDAADDLLCVDLGGRRIINTKKQQCRLKLTSPLHSNVSQGSNNPQPYRH